MEGRKFGGKITIDGHSANRIGHRLKKTARRNLSTMNQAKIIVNDADESNSDELIIEFKKWRSLGRSQHPAAQRLAVSGTSQKDSSAVCPGDNRIGVIRAKAEDEVIREKWCENKASLHVFADVMPVMIWISGPDKLCTWFNKSWLNFVGSSTEQELGNGWVKHVHRDDQSSCINAYECALDARLPFTRSYRLRRHDGEYRWVLDQALPQFAPTGDFTGYMGCCVDITEQKQIEEGLRENDRRKDQFLAHMSHEIRSPMTSILAYADILLSRLRDADDIECVKIIKQGGNHLLELIGDILDLSKIGSGKLKINKEIVSLPTLINEVHSLMEVRAKEKKLPLILRYEGAIPENIETDRTRLRQILFNLVSNAIKFTAEGSVKIIARFLPNDSALEVEVVDTGIGISKEQQGRLFQPFMQASSVTTRGQEGTGLGLAITKQLVSMLGGEIFFESVPTKGSSFRIKMPIICSPEPTAGTSNGANSAAARRRSKILLVDDNQMVCKAIGRLLEISGHEVAVAFDGKSALETVRRFPADVVVLDLKLPDMGGYELLGQLKKLKTLANTKSIALTGYGEEFRQNGGVRFDHFLTKPVDAKALEAFLSPVEPSILTSIS